MTDNQVEEVKAKTDIVTVIGEYVNLTKAGRNYKANCPFHNEKSPSFIVSPEMQRYKCFGCGVSGDVFTFLEEYEGLEFYEALKSLASKANIKLKKPTGNKSDKEKLLEVNSLLAKFYHYLLVKHPIGKPALHYLLDIRKLKRETLETFQLGFSPEDSSIFRQFIIGKKKIDTKILHTLGILVDEKKIWDRFRGRIIFPLIDHRGEPIGFAGRILPQFDSGKVGKYINSPQTPLYQKSFHLYGLNITRSDIKKKREVIMVEGELDLISVWQAGIKNTVAIKGSAITQEQSFLIRRFADRVILALDADIAGDAAARRGIAIAEKAGLEVRIAQLGKYKDPDDAVKANPDDFRKIIATAVPIWDFLIESAIARYGDSTGVQKSKVSKEIVPVLALINDQIVKAHYIGIAAKKLGVPVEAVTKQVAGYHVEKNAQVPKLEFVQPKEGTHRRDLIERRLLAVAFANDPTNLLTNEIKSSFRTVLAIKIIDCYKSFMRINKQYNLSGFSSYLPQELYEGFSDAIMEDLSNQGKNASPDREFNMLVVELNKLDIKQELETLAESFIKLESTKQKKELKEAQKLFREKSHQLAEIEKRSLLK
ncbi:DNA primase [Candidatus Woesebacteria bacterium]|nr:MAG: DNA primase [Candidatus Woesebacteria bacterium]